MTEDQAKERQLEDYYSSIVTIRPTARIVILDGVVCRIWTGYTLDGRYVETYIYRISTDNWVQQEIFARALSEQPFPGEIQTRP